jgi:hypothetical protein
MEPKCRLLPAIKPQKQSPNSYSTQPTGPKSKKEFSSERKGRQEQFKLPAASSKQQSSRYKAIAERSISPSQREIEKLPVSSVSKSLLKPKKPESLLTLKTMENPSPVN